MSLRLVGGGEVCRPLRLVQAREVVAARPWRTTRSAKGQTHYPGFYWSATTGMHVIYESRLELARLLLADFDPDVVAIGAQPFGLKASVDGRARRHVPDFLLVHTDGSAVVVNVKPAGRLADPEVAEALDWPRRLFEAHGWGYQVWSGEDPVYLANVRFLAGYRRPGLLAEALLAEVLDAVGPGDCVTTLTSRMGRTRPAPAVKAAVLRLLWQRRLTTDLRCRLDGASPLRAAS
ncbi:TnsA-like heteromeric transposase endonuclease subunit [Frankia sp. KB5]|uniref:TnsA-like heteromeric transposase endonuclease subunit n=1 Tax=Frankia sp. KB5 TaxID=683318 RepID=UPI000A103CF2|nr:TnsA-like heteromeric transposase endonuclease subunit [Frankia sp. KB5]ORT46866.1 hypothetical protein KBI5_22880 [Frankia sp. KB5]